MPWLPNRVVAVAGRDPAATIFLDNEADALIYYATGVPSPLKQVGGLTNSPLPATLEANFIYGLTIPRENLAAARFGLFILASTGKDIPAHFGLAPIATTS